MFGAMTDFNQRASSVIRQTPFIVLFSLLLIPALALSANAPTAEELSPQETAILEESLEALAKAVGLTETTTAQPTRKVKIAIFDTGFRGVEKAIGETLDASTRMRKPPVPVDPKGEDGHGLKMAELVTGLLARTETPYELHLFQTGGYTNLEAAIETTILEEFDIISHSQVWEYGENDDGRGFINSLVNRATSKGITWVNAVGNFGKSTYRAPVDRIADDWAYLPGPNNSVQIRCFKNDAKVCRIRLVLAWNSFSPDVNQGTDKDLDLVLSDDTLKVIQTGGLIQKKVIAPGDIGASLYPREIIEAEVKPGLYYARVKIRSSNFTKSDILRITSSGDHTEMLNRTEGETLLAPADNASVIVIGASDSTIDSASRSKNRPDFRSASLVKTKDGGAFKGSSNTASAFTARIAAELSKYKRGELSRESILQILRGSTPRTGVGRNTSSDNRSGTLSEIRATTGGCYTFHALQITPNHIRKMLREGGVVVDTTSGPKVFIDENPFDRAARLGLTVTNESSNRESNAANSILVADVSGLFSVSIQNRAQLSQGTVEFVRTPSGATYCPLR